MGVERQQRAGTVCQAHQIRQGAGHDVSAFGNTFICCLNGSIPSSAPPNIIMSESIEAHQPGVKLLDPAPQLSYSHHGPSASKTSLGGKPKYFQNPWKSWRQPSVSDAWIAYQQGAAIARPLRKKKKRLAKEREEGLQSSSPIEDRLEDSSDEEDEAVEKAPMDSKDIRLEPEPSKVYIRPELTRLEKENEHHLWKDPPVEVISPKWDTSDKVDVTWLGHASTLVRIPFKNQTDGAEKCNVLFDPIFSYRCSPSQYVGPARYLDTPCKVEDLPPVHIYCISHDHCTLSIYLLSPLSDRSLTLDDHLDYQTVLDLWKYHSETIYFFVPLGLGQWFTSSGIPEERVKELDWWHEVILTYPPTSSDSEEPALQLKLACTPAQHRSGRGVADHMCALWASWCLGVVEAEDAAKAEERGMQGWKGFRLFFGGWVSLVFGRGVEEGRGLTPVTPGTDMPQRLKTILMPSAPHSRVCQHQPPSFPPLHPPERSKNITDSRNIRPLRPNVPLPPPHLHRLLATLPPHGPLSLLGSIHAHLLSALLARRCTGTTQDHAGREESGYTLGYILRFG